jgi:hypothetical protein
MMLITERHVSYPEQMEDRARLANVPRDRMHAYVLGNLTPDSREICRYAYKMYERNAISGVWSYMYWVQPHEVNEDKDLLVD